MVKLLSFKPSDRPGKKYMVVVETGQGTKRTIHFGDSSMKDFTLFSAVERAARKRAYLARHERREDWNDPLTPGFWSRHVLWGDTPSVQQNLKITRERYDL